MIRFFVSPLKHRMFLNKCVHLRQNTLTLIYVPPDGEVVSMTTMMINLETPSVSSSLFVSHSD